METPFLVAVLLLALSSSSFTRGQRIIQIPPPRPLCASQYALANYACSRLPMNTVPLPSPIAPPSPPIFPPPPPPHHDHDHDDEHDHEHDHGDHHDDDHDHDEDDHDDHDHDHDDHDHDHDHDHNDHDHNRDHDHDHDDDNHHDNNHNHRRHHHHHHHHQRHREETFAQQECCKWLKQMDNECVCDLLVRLPPLLAKPAHNYTVFVDESCIVTYTCGGRLMS
ncbi:hypothetical protein F2Q70_00044302 [Brassica cretica]|uniref:Bifunctional inhibitor/plant lipid transfer protein/seed storage helical domain-containing protein n=1 Tax=Brassica cretica TaxID=69181 RepID=A0A8S9KI68_BRACR|nr:hypothetical protein F2Q70_00044302 [Brassica cretica]